MAQEYGESNAWLYVAWGAYIISMILFWVSGSAIFVGPITGLEWLASALFFYILAKATFTSSPRR